MTPQHTPFFSFPSPPLNKLPSFFQSRSSMANCTAQQAYPRGPMVPQSFPRQDICQFMRKDRYAGLAGDQPKVQRSTG